MIVEFPIGACRLGGVDITAADDVAVGRIEIQRTGHVLELWKWEKLYYREGQYIDRKTLWGRDRWIYLHREVKPG